jgi:hypothetical protein
MTSNYETTKSWRAQNKDKVNEQARRYRAKHPDKVQAIKQRFRAAHLDEVREQDAAAARKRRADPEGNRRRIAAFKARKEAERVQLAGRPRPLACELCGAPGKTVFDHCHAKGHFRGWLCQRCNRVLGSVEDNPPLLRHMAAYLELNNGETLSGTTEQDAEFQLRVAGERNG